MGEHAIPHYALRLRRVIEGEQHGICKAANWTSGSDFQLYRLGDAMFNNAGRIKSGFGERKIGGQGWIRTSVRKTGQIYSLLPLTTRPPVHFFCGY